MILRLSHAGYKMIATRQMPVMPKVLGFLRFTKALQTSAAKT
jgi:hypothetical protein